MDRRVAILGAVVAALGLSIGATQGADDAEPPAPSATPRTTTAGAPVAVPEPPLLLANMSSLDADDIHIEVDGPVRRLRFAASLANVGPGPLLLRPRGRGDCGPRQHSAIQVVFADGDGDGRYKRWRDTATTRQFAGCMLRHRGHDHWHFDAMAAYSLRRPGSTRVLVARDKVSFCLRDNIKVPGVRVVVRREHFGDCTATGPQGISPGWADVYGADLDGQWLRLPRGVRDEVVCLDLAADPKDLIEETDETDNSASVALRVAGEGVRRVGRAQCLEPVAG